MRSPKTLIAATEGLELSSLLDPVTIEVRPHLLLAPSEIRSKICINIGGDRNETEYFRIETARLTRLCSASARYGKSFDWLLELDIAEARAHVDSPAWSEWLSDLRMLGLRPGAMVAGRGHVVTPEAE